MRARSLLFFFSYLATRLSATRDLRHSPFHSQPQDIASYRRSDTTPCSSLRTKISHHWPPERTTLVKRLTPRHTNNVTRTTTSNTHLTTSSPRLHIFPVFINTMCLPNPFSKSFHRQQRTPRDEKHANRANERQTNGLLAIALKSKQNDSVNSFTARDPAVFYQRREDHEQWARHEGGGKRLVRESLFEKLKIP